MITVGNATGLWESIIAMGTQVIIIIILIITSAVSMEDLLYSAAPCIRTITEACLRSATV